MSYEDIYNKYYAKMPKIISIILGTLLSLVGLVEVLIATDSFSDRYEGILEFIVGNGPYVAEIFALMIWCAVASLIAYAIHFVVKIAMSQKIMVVDRLTQIRDNTQSK